MKILVGKKVIMTPIMPSEFNYLIDVYEQEKKNKLYELKYGTREETIDNLNHIYNEGTFKGWMVYENQGKKSRKVGVVFLTDNSEHKVEVNGAIDKQFLRGLAKRLKVKDGRETYSEESLRLLVNFCLNDLNKNRVESVVVSDNKLAIQLSKSVGFKREGILRKFMKIGNDFVDLVMLSILREEWENGLNNKCSGT